MTELTNLSKYLSYILRHKPESIGLTMTNQGWVNIKELVAASLTHGTEITDEVIREIVKTSEKQRFAISDDGLLIRANQGHSIQIELELEEKIPPNLLYHGTTERFTDSIRLHGILKMKRNHVHLSDSEDKALHVGMRRGKAVLLSVKSGSMHEDGIKFYLSQNNVWLTERVLPEYIQWNL